MTTFDGSPLGKATDYPDRYDASLLFAVPRAPQRAALGIEGNLPFFGCDVWNAYEITWLDLQGRPRLAIGELRVSAESPAMVESKSLKLYLGSFAQEPLASATALRERIAAELSRVCDDEVAVALTPSVTFEAAVPQRVASTRSESIDETDVTIEASHPDPALLAHAEVPIDESLSSSLFRSTCPGPVSPITPTYSFATAVRGSIVPACCDTWSRFADMPRFTKPAWSEYSSTSQIAADRKGSVSTRGSCAAGASTSIHSEAISSRHRRTTYVHSDSSRPAAFDRPAPTFACRRV